MLAPLQERYWPDHTATSPLGGVLQCASMTKKPQFDAANWTDYRVFGRYALVYILEGSGTYQQPGRPGHRLTPGDLMVIFPDVPHKYPVGSDGSREFFIVFSGPVFELWDRMGLLGRDEPVLHLEPISTWESRMRSVVGGDPVEEVQRLQSLLTHIHLRRKQIDGDDEWTARARRLIDENPEQTLNLERVAETMGISYSTFRRRFSEAFGMTPGKYRATRVIDRACELMMSSHFTNQQIAEELGFTDACHFSRRFKQVTGHTPSQFRRSMAAMSATPPPLR